MQLTNIALATIFVTFLVTSSVRCGESDPARSEPTEPTVAPYPSQSSAQPSVLPESAGEGSAPSQSSMTSTSALNPQTLTDFQEAVRVGNFSKAWEVYAKANDETRKQCGEHFVNLGEDGLVHMIGGIHFLDKGRMLGIVFAHADQDLFNEIIDKVKPNDGLLSWSASKNVDLACNTDRFMTVVKRITKKDGQVVTTRSDVNALFRKDKTECLDPMISALQSEASPDPDLAKYAIRVAFLNACYCTDHRSSFAERFHDHPAVSAKDYSSALYIAYHFGKPDYKLFNGLIERADRDDLNTFISNPKFSSLPLNFQAALQEYVQKPFFPETRHERGDRLRRERREKVKEVLEARDFKEHTLPPVLTNIINEYGID